MRLSMLEQGALVPWYPLTPSPPGLAAGITERREGAARPLGIRPGPAKGHLHAGACPGLSSPQALSAHPRPAGPTRSSWQQLPWLHFRAGRRAPPGVGTAGTVGGLRQEGQGTSCCPQGTARVVTSPLEGSPSSPLGWGRTGARDKEAVCAKATDRSGAPGSPSAVMLRFKEECRHEAFRESVCLLWPQPSRQQLPT